MSWIGALAGVGLVWLMAGLLGWREGGLVMLAAVAGAWIGGLHKRIATLERESRERGAQIDATLRAMQRAEPRPVAAPTVARATDLEVTAPLPPPRPSAAAAVPPVTTELPARPPAPVSSGAKVSPPTHPAAALEPDETSLPVTTSIAASVLAWFRGGNTIVRIAVVVLFFGVAFLLRYAAEHALVPIEVRVALVALGGLALAVVGWRLREARRGYALSLQGAGVGVIYLTLFAALRLYQLVPAGLTFALLAALAAVSALLAVRQNALPLAVLGFGGGFLAPILTSTGAGSHVALFSYYLVLNVAIAWIAGRQAWKLLNLVGFLFTFSIGALWGARSYVPADFASTEPFLIAHFGLYLWIAVQYTRGLAAANEARGLRVPMVDGGLLFGVPIAAFGLQAAMLRDEPLQLAFSAAVLSAIYLGVGWRLWRVAGQRMVLLIEGMLALGLVFLILVTPLALDARWTAAAWAVQGAGIVWVALRQRRAWAAALGSALQLVAAASFWPDAVREPDALPFANPLLLGALLLAAWALVTARLLQQHTLKADAASPAVRQAFGLGHLVMLGLGLLQAIAGLEPEARALGEGVAGSTTAAVAVLAVLAALLETVRRRLAWRELRVAAHLLVGWALLLSLVGAVDAWPSVARTWAHVSAQGGWLEVLVLLGLGGWMLRRDETPTRAEPVVLCWYAMLQGALMVWVLAAHHVARHHGWTPAAAVAVPALLALALLAREQRGQWPVHGAWREFDLGLMRPLLVLLGLWVLAANAFSDASMAPLPYLPLLNPIDLAHGLIAILALRWWRRSGVRAQGVQLALGLGAFWWLNGLLVRTLHHGAGTPMWEGGAWDSGTVQTGLTILWTLVALATMWLATRRAARGVWMAGAALLGVVLAKLFLLDLSHVGALARIVSFLGVGALMLVIGYLSPLPPALKEERP